MIQKHLVYQWTRKVLYTCCLLDLSSPSCSFSYPSTLSSPVFLLMCLPLPPPSRLFHKLASSLDPHPPNTHTLPPFPSSSSSLILHLCPVSSLSFMLVLLPFHILLTSFLSFLHVSPLPLSFQPLPHLFFLNYIPRSFPLLLPCSCILAPSFQATLPPFPPPPTSFPYPPLSMFLLQAIKY